MVAALPPASTTWVHFENSSHAIAGDEPDKFGAVIRSFIAD
jgi:pimeloyl-ACP methyl ester carboxylesterase